MPGNDGQRARPNELLEALSRPHRRRVLCLLGAERRSAGVGDGRGARVEPAHAHGRTVAADPNVLFAGLPDCPFPNLVEWGYLGWDERRGAVRRGPRFEELAPLLEHLHRTETGAVVPDG